uniref:RE65113p n=1 Tax=Drosophila melanogaster TaxID=7227 RepID=Q8SYE7_DROME|nr:RE65113p [Drosophila melanogaster]
MHSGTSGWPSSIRLVTIGNATDSYLFICPSCKQSHEDCVKIFGNSNWHFKESRTTVLGGELKLITES